MKILSLFSFFFSLFNIVRSFLLMCILAFFVVMFWSWHFFIQYSLMYSFFFGDFFILFYSFLFYFFNFFSFLFCFNSLNILLVCLTVFLFPICILISYSTIKYRLVEYLLLLFFLQFLLIFFFIVDDFFLFFVCYELILVPMFMLITVWGSRLRKIHAGYQFFFFTFCGSFPLFLVLIWLFSEVHFTLFLTINDFFFFFDSQLFLLSSSSLFFFKILWLAFFISFCIKVPVYPFHIWLPEAHVEASTVGSVLLAGLLLKMGVFGLYRTVFVFLPNLSFFFLPFICCLCFFGIIYTSLITIRQVDLKKIIAYSSVGHMGFCVLGLFFNTIETISASFFILFSHGFISSFLFICIGFLYERFFTRNLSYFGGLVNLLPSFVIPFFLGILSNMSFPTTCSFVGELLIFFSLFACYSFFTILLSLSIIFCGIYNIWLFNRLCFGFVNLRLGLKFGILDLSFFEQLLLWFFCFLIVFWGVFPTSLLTVLESLCFDFING